MRPFRSRDVLPRRRWRLAAVGMAGALFLALSMFALTTGNGPLLDDDLCPVVASDDAGVDVLLLDLRKPVDVARAAEPGELLRDVAAASPRGRELHVFALGRRVAQPLEPLARLCKLAADRAALADCRALGVRTGDLNAAGYCARLRVLQDRVDELAVQRHDLPLRSAYLVEAIEESWLVAPGVPGPRSLHVFSDMVQHAEWYSHADTGSAGWDFAGFVAARAEQAATVSAAPSPPADARVEVFYVPRAGGTEHRVARDAHQRFWREYFDSQGIEARFVDQPAMREYAVAPAAGAATGLASAALERDRLERERKLVRRAASDVEAARVALEAARREAGAATLQSDLLRAREAEARRQVGALRAEIARLAASRNGATPPAIRTL